MSTVLTTYNTMTVCQDCGASKSPYSSSDFCNECQNDRYIKNDPNWKNSHICQMCKKVFPYQKSMSYLECSCSYNACCSDHCRDAYLQIQFNFDMYATEFLLTHMQ